MVSLKVSLVMLFGLNIIRRKKNCMKTVFPGMKVQEEGWNNGGTGTGVGVGVKM